MRRIGAERCLTLADSNVVDPHLLRKCSRRVRIAGPASSHGQVQKNEERVHIHPSCTVGGSVRPIFKLGKTFVSWPKCTTHNCTGARCQSRFRCRHALSNLQSIHPLLVAIVETATNLGRVLDWNQDNPVTANYRHPASRSRHLLKKSSKVGALGQQSNN